MQSLKIKFFIRHSGTVVHHHESTTAHPLERQLPVNMVRDTLVPAGSENALKHRSSYFLVETW